jgi:hypothetical protein
LHSSKQTTIRNKEKEVNLIWSKNKGYWNYIAKLGYEVKVEEEAKNKRKWWNKYIWKVLYPLKMKIFIWLVLLNKILTCNTCQNIT